MSSIAEEMSAAAVEAMKLTRKYFVVELDFSAASLKTLDALFDDVEFTMPGGKSDDNVDLLTRVWGSYLGEVIRRNLGGDWIDGHSDGQNALQIQDEKIAPHCIVRGRLDSSAKASVFKTYEDLQRRTG